MSTSINELAFALYEEIPRSGLKESKLKLLVTDPIMSVSRWSWKVYKLLKGDYRNKSYINNFKATDKKFPGTKIAVYTAITGGYDNLKDPIYVDDELDYYAFVDDLSVNMITGGGYGKRLLFLRGLKL